MLASRIFPKEQITSQLGLSKIILLAVMMGLIVSSGGVVKMNFRQTLIGWLLGISSSFLAFNILFFGSLLLVRLSPTFFTKYFLGSEIIIVSATLSTAIAFFVWLDQVQSVKAMYFATAILLISAVISWLTMQIISTPLPVIAIISWPLSYFLLRFLKAEPSE